MCGTSHGHFTSDCQDVSVGLLLLRVICGPDVAGEAETCGTGGEFASLLLL